MELSKCVVDGYFALHRTNFDWCSATWYGSNYTAHSWPAYQQLFRRIEHVVSHLPCSLLTSWFYQFFSWWHGLARLPHCRIAQVKILSVEKAKTPTHPTRRVIQPSSLAARSRMSAMAGVSYHPLRAQKSTTLHSRWMTKGLC